MPRGSLASELASAPPEQTEGAMRIRHPGSFLDSASSLDPPWCPPVWRWVPSWEAQGHQGGWMSEQMENGRLFGKERVRAKGRDSVQQHLRQPAWALWATEPSPWNGFCRL
ncbi:hypothetical protein H1C71_012084 [Ictidomys tridecemlineatus]|nr:hypothetical protein H1C71_012084 [Ictidomys tridecemlineatus]